MKPQYTLVTPTFSGHFAKVELLLQSIENFCLDLDKIEYLFVIDDKEISNFLDRINKFRRIKIRVISTEDVFAELNINWKPGLFLNRVGKFSYQTLKKLGGILSSNTEWNLILDSEALFINNFRFEELFNNYTKQKYVFYTSTIRRGAYFNALGSEVNQNTARLFHIKSIDEWYMDVFSWFYQKSIVEDLCKSSVGKQLIEQLNKTNSMVHYFECVLYYAFLRNNQNRYSDYKFINLEDAINELVEEPVKGRFVLNQMPFARHGNDFFMTITAPNEVNCWKPFVDKYKIPFFRLEPCYLSNDYLPAIKNLITGIVSTQYLTWLKKKIAICISGEFKQDDFYVFEQQVRHILGFVVGVECDIYMHTWRSPVEPFVEHCLPLKGYSFEKQPDYSNLAKQIRVHENSPLKPGRDAGSLAMFDSIQRCFNLINNPDDYECIVRMRPDIYSVFSLKEVLYRICDSGFFDREAIYIPRNYNSKGINDQIALGSPKAMSIYSRCFNWIAQNLSNKLFNPEFLLLSYLIERKIHIRHMDFPYALHRGIVIRPDTTFGLLLSQEHVFWQKTTPLPLFTDVTDFYRNKLLSTETVNELRCNTSIVAELEKRYVVLVETYDFCPEVNVSLFKRIAFIAYPVRFSKFCLKKFGDSFVEYGDRIFFLKIDKSLEGRGEVIASLCNWKGYKTFRFSLEKIKFCDRTSPVCRYLLEVRKLSFWMFNRIRMFRDYFVNLKRKIF